MQQQGGGTPQPHYGVVVPSSLPEPAATATVTSTTAAAAPSMAAEAAADQAHVVEEASPISSRPPAGGAISTVNLDELMTLSGAAADVAADQGGGSGGGNRWPRQETLALLKIRSEMDVAFRDATLKGPLWEDVSRKLAELGYKRNAKKCKEKFENVHKYYKRTKEGRAGRQDGKSYKFFSELEALHGTASSSPNVPASPPVHVTAAAVATAPVSIGFGSISNPVPLSYRMTTTGNTSTVPVMSSQGQASIPVIPSAQPPTTAAPMDINFSSNSSSSSHGEDDDYEDEDDVAGEPNTSRKRKRGTSSSRESGGSTRRMMEFFEILMKQVMQKQETMQQRFLEVIEKREQDRNIREEAWKRQEMARLTREHELMTQERAISASRDAAIIAFLQKITGQTIQLPPPLNVHNTPPPPVPPSVSFHVTPVSAPPPLQQQQSVQQVHQHQQQQQTPTAHISRHQIQTSIPPNPQMDIVCVPDQQVAAPQDNVVGSGGGFEATISSSRWPKAEVLALIKLRSGLETRYQEAGPKGPLWEEISAGMQRMGYKRNPKRCKEKWENINKYFKKVKESNKARPEDAKTCPYFHELDALYRKRVLGGGPSGGSSSSLGNQIIQQQPQLLLKMDSATQGTVANAPQLTQGTVVAAADQSVNKSGDNSPSLQKNLFGDAPEEAAKKPEDIVKELMGQQQQQHHHHQQHQVLNQQGVQQQLVVEDYDRVEEADSDINLDQDEEEEDDEDDEEDEEMDEESRKMDYKIEYQKQQNTGPSSNGGGNGAPSFLAMVQ